MEADIGRERKSRFGHPLFLYLLILPCVYVLGYLLLKERVFDREDLPVTWMLHVPFFFLEQWGFRFPLLFWALFLSPLIIGHKRTGRLVATQFLKIFVFYFFLTVLFLQYFPAQT